MKNFIKRIFGSAGEKKLAVYRTRLPQINALAEGLQAATDDDLRAAFADLRRRQSEGETADSLLCEVFAIVREVSSRTLGIASF